jgi:hypothetical protein
METSTAMNHIRVNKVKLMNLLHSNEHCQGFMYLVLALALLVALGIVVRTYWKETTDSKGNKTYAHSAGTRWGVVILVGGFFLAVMYYFWKHMNGITNGNSLNAVLLDVTK